MIKSNVEQWLKNVVIGLNLCPFASRPFDDNRVRIQISESTTEEELLQDLADEIKLLDQSPAQELETTLLVVSEFLSDFEDYNQFLDMVDLLLEQFNWTGLYQIASFHPDYQFAETEPDDAENLTNRAPYPILHIIREASVEAALEKYPNPESIPQKNIQTVESLTEKQKRELFPYLFK